MKLTLKDDLDLDMSPLKIYSSMRYKYMLNIKFLSTIVDFFLPLTLKDDLDLDLSPLKMCSFMICTCMPNIKFLSAIVEYILILFKFCILTNVFDL